MPFLRRPWFCASLVWLNRSLLLSRWNGTRFVRKLLWCKGSTWDSKSSSRSSNLRGSSSFSCRLLSLIQLPFHFSFSSSEIIDECFSHFSWLEIRCWCLLIKFDKLGINWSWGVNGCMPSLGLGGPRSKLGRVLLFRSREIVGELSINKL